ELHAVPDQQPPAVPVRRPRRAAPAAKKPGRGTASKTGSDFDEHVRTATEWLQTEPDLSGKQIGDRLGTGDSYGRRIKRAALAGGTGTGPGRERPMEGGYA
ncbi:MAG: hypothetical protein ACRDQ0_00835, partial [Pseudonocardia sp.]